MMNLLFHLVFVMNLLFHLFSKIVFHKLEYIHYGVILKSDNYEYDDIALTDFVLQVPRIQYQVF